MNPFSLTRCESNQIEDKLIDSAEKTTINCRASLFTLVIWTKRGQAEALCRFIIEKLSSKLPARILIVIEDPNIHELTTKTASLIKEGVISDLVQIESTPDRKEQVLSIVLPLILSDLPAFLFIATPFSLKDPFIESATSSFSRIIVDLSLMEDPSLFLNELKAETENVQSYFYEVNWAKTKGWRQAFGRIFDTKERLHALNKTRFLYIRYKVQSHDDLPPMAAILLQGWIAKQLNWKLRERVTLAHQREKIIYQSNGLELAVELEGVFDNEENEEILSLDITTWEEQFFSFTKHSGKNQLQIHISDMETCELPQTLPLETGVGSFRFFRALFYEPQDPIWKEIRLT